MKCAKCGSGMKEGVTLIRINPVGEVGIFICQENCNAFIEDDEERRLVEIIQNDWFEEK